MILSCPACSTRYSVPDEALGAKGRAVRCAACSHSWRVDATGAVIAPSAPEPKPEPEAELGAASEGASPRAPASAPHRAYRAKVEQRKRRRRRTIAAGAWGGIAACLVLALGFAWAFRADIVQILPQTASAYALTGADVNLYGLAIENMVSERVMEAGEPALSVRAELRNIDRKPRAAPLVRFDLRDADGEAFFAWTVAPEAAELAPGETIPVAAVLINPPERAAEVLATLTDEPIAPDGAPAPAQGGGAVAQDNPGASEATGDPTGDTSQLHAAGGGA